MSTPGSMTSARQKLYFGSQCVLLVVAVSAAVVVARRGLAAVGPPDPPRRPGRGKRADGDHDPQPAAVRVVRRDDPGHDAPRAGAGLVIGVVADFLWFIGVAPLKKPFMDRVTDQATNAVFLVTGALLIRLLIGDVHHPHNARVLGVVFPVVVFSVFMATNALNFLLIATNKWVTQGRSIIRQTRDSFVPMLPSQLAAAALTAILAGAYVHLGAPVLVGVIVVLVTFQYLAVALLRSRSAASSFERAAFGWHRCNWACSAL